MTCASSSQYRRPPSPGPIAHALRKHGANELALERLDYVVSNDIRIDDNWLIIRAETLAALERFDQIEAALANVVPGSEGQQRRVMRLLNTARVNLDDSSAR